MKETAMIERRKKKSGRQRDEEEEEKSKKSKSITNLGKCIEKSAETLLVPKITAQQNVKPDQTSRAMDFGQLERKYNH